MALTSFIPGNSSSPERRQSDAALFDEVMAGSIAVFQAGTESVLGAPDVRAAQAVTEALPQALAIVPETTTSGEMTPQISTEVAFLADQRRAQAIQDARERAEEARRAA